MATIGLTPVFSTEHATRSALVVRSRRVFVTRRVKPTGSPLLAQVRTALLLTQAEFGARMGVSKRTVIRWEQADSLATPAILMQAASLIQTQDARLAAAVRAGALRLGAVLGLAPGEVDPSLIPARSAEAIALDGVLAAAALGLRVSMDAARPALRAALVRAQASGLTMARLIELLGSPP